MRSVRFTTPADADLEAIGDWIAQEDPLRAATFIVALRKAALALSKYSRRYPVASPLTGLDIRKRLYRDYLIFYRVPEQEVQILRVVHAARDWVTVVHETV